VDPTGANGVLQTFPPKSTRQIENPAGGTFSAAMDAQQIFDAQDDAGVATSDNVFAALNGLRVALRSHSATAVTASVDSVTQASTRLNLAQSFYGAVQNRIDAASEFTSAYDLRLRTEISEKEDADITTAALELTQAQTHLNASFQMQGQMPHSSLFDYLG
jgi:flagellin-like hook-associated protein FlgL